jgi:hypothetical protein
LRKSFGESAANQGNIFFHSQLSTSFSLTDRYDGFNSEPETGSVRASHVYHCLPVGSLAIREMTVVI